MVPSEIEQDKSKRERTAASPVAAAAVTTSHELVTQRKYPLSSQLPSPLRHTAEARNASSHADHRIELMSSFEDI